MESQACSIDDCDRSVEARDLCSKHYDRWRKHGDPRKVLRIVGDDDARFWSKVSKGGPPPKHRPELGPCWEWTGSKVRGYGNFKCGGRIAKAHRWSYQRSCGAIPEGLQIDHLCRNRSCVRPDHLEPVTNYENWRRGESPSRLVAVTGLCSRGHSMADACVFPSGERTCRTCRDERGRKARSDRNSAQHHLNRPAKYRRLTVEQIETIVQLAGFGDKHGKIAEAVGCSRTTVSRILRSCCNASSYAKGAT